MTPLESWLANDPARVALAADRELCSSSLAEFVRGAWPVLEPGTPLLWNWHLDVLCVYLDAFFSGRIKRLILNVPPGTMKSLLVSVLGPAWHWARDPSARIINLTNELGLATRDSLRMRQVVSSDWYQARWGDRVKLDRDQGEKLYFANSARGFRQGLGLGANLTGKRGSFLLIDDPLDAKRAYSDIQCQTVNDTYDQAVSSRLNDPARDGICLIMQRLRTNDLTGHLQGKKATDWTVVRIPMRAEAEPGYDPVRDLGPDFACYADPRKPGDLLFPERFPAHVVEALEEDLGEYGSAGQLQQRPSPLAGGILRASAWQVWPDDRPLPHVLHAFASWDTAFSEKALEQAAYSACTVWGVWLDERDPSPAHPEGRHKLILLSAWWGRVDFPDLIERARVIQREKLTHPHDAHLVESKASGISLIQTLRRKPELRILGYDPKRDGGGDKVARAYRVQPLLQAGLIYVPNRQWAHELVRIVGEFPAGGPPCADLTDTVTQALSYLDQGWWIHHPDDDSAPTPAVALDDEDDEDMTRLETGRIYG